MFSTRFVFGVCVSLIAFCLVVKKELSQPHSKTPSVHMRSEVNEPKQLGPTIEKQGEKKSETQNQMKPVAAQQLAVDHWQLQRAQARKYFSNTPTGIAASEVVALLGLHAEQTVYRSTFDQAMSYLKGHPHESLRELASKLPSLPPEMNEGRNFLVQIATQLEVPRELKVEFLRNELAYQLRNEGAGSETRFHTSIVFDALMDLTTDKEILMNEARKLAKQYKKSEGSRTALLRFAARFPAEAKAIKAELADAGL